jgi:rhodanese-related sulfurtransferase
LRWILDAEQAAELLETANQVAVGEAPQGGPAFTSFNFSSDSLASMMDKHGRRSRGNRLLRYFGSWCGLLRPGRRPVTHEKSQDKSRQLQDVTTLSILIVDLRNTSEFRESNVPRSISVPLQGLREGLAGGDLFGNAEAVHAVWTQVQTWLQGAELSRMLIDTAKSDRKVLILCYDGFTSQLASSAFREKNIEAFSVRGGFQALYEHIQAKRQP